MAVIGWKRFIVGGLGGLAPVFALLVAIDFERNLADATTAKMLGYAVRVFALFAVGGFIAWLHETEGQMFKLFEIGVGAPALLAGLITSHSVLQKGPPPVAMSGGTQVTRWIPLAAAQAQGQAVSRPEVKSFTLPEQGGSAGFWEGLLGARPSNVYYVISGSHLTYEDARAQASKINGTTQSIRAQVYAPYGNNPYYAVVIGEQLTSAQASSLRKSAIAAGLARDTYLWSPAFPAPMDATQAPSRGPWGVVIGGDQKLAAAEQVMQATARQSGLRDVGIFMRDGMYRSVAVYEDRSAAEDALGRAKSRIKDPYLVDLGKWCPVIVQRDAHKECSRS